MIRLHRPPAPPELDAETVRKLTEAYQQTGKDVWKKSYIQERLLAMSHRKCAYCECRIQDGGSYLEIEHFYPKSIYQHLVVDWENLLPCCARCNRKKLDHDPKVSPIVHPVENDPKAFFQISMIEDTPRLEAREDNPVARTTIRRLLLNDPEHLLGPRTAICKQLRRSLQLLFADLMETETASASRTQRSVERLTNLLETANPPAIFAATAATVLLTDPHYGPIKAYFHTHGLWEATLDGLESQALGCSLAA